MTRIILISAIVAAAAVGTIWWFRSQVNSPATPRARWQQPGDSADTSVIVMAFGSDWTRRFGCTPEELDGALIKGADADLAQRIGAEVGVIDLRFDASAESSDLAVTLLVTYASTGERATARLTLPWDDVPQTVRADVMRSPGAPVFRKWSADS